MAGLFSSKAKVTTLQFQFQGKRFKEASGLIIQGQKSWPINEGRAEITAPAGTVMVMFDGMSAFPLPLGEDQIGDIIPLELKAEDILSIKEAAAAAKGEEHAPTHGDAHGGDHGGHGADPLVLRANRFSWFGIVAVVLALGGLAYMSLGGSGANLMNAVVVQGLTFWFRIVIALATAAAVMFECGARGQAADFIWAAMAFMINQLFGADWFHRVMAALVPQATPWAMNFAGTVTSIVVLYGSAMLNGRDLSTPTGAIGITAMFPETGFGAIGKLLGLSATNTMVIMMLCFAIAQNLIDIMFPAKGKRRLSTILLAGLAFTIFMVLRYPLVETGWRGIHLPLGFWWAFVTLVLFFVASSGDEYYSGQADSNAGSLAWLINSVDHMRKSKQFDAVIFFALLSFLAMFAGWIVRFN